MPRPTARATATLLLRTSSSSSATAPLPTRNSQLTSNGYSAEEHDLSALVPYRYAGVYKRVSENGICRKFILLHKNVHKQSVRLLPQPPSVHPLQRFALLAYEIDTHGTWPRFRL